jgi:hypothetical protein
MRQTSRRCALRIEDCATLLVGPTAGRNCGVTRSHKPWDIALCLSPGGKPPAHIFL